MDHVSTKQSSAMNTIKAMSTMTSYKNPWEFPRLVYNIINKRQSELKLGRKYL